MPAAPDDNSTSASGSRGSDHASSGAPSLTGNSIAQFVADGAVYGSALVASVLVARWLGPAAKGTISVLLFIAHAVLFWIVTLGARDAIIVVVGRGRAGLGQALSALLVPLLLSSASGVAVLWLVIPQADWYGISSAVWVAGITLIVMVYADTGEAALAAHERLVATATTRGSAAVLTAAFTAIFVVFLNGGILGAVLAVGAAQLVRLVGVSGLLLRSKVSIRPRWEPSTIRGLAAVGVTVSASYLVIILSQRFDQVIVYALAGESQAGIYSVALTMGQLSAYLSNALSASSFPRIARITTSEAWNLTFLVARMGLVGTAGLVGLLLVVIPVLTVPLFGEAFRGSIAPALILLIGGAFWSQQWILARAAAARHRPRLLLMSFLTNVLVMALLDVALIPAFGTIGAAVASTASSLVGYGICLGWYSRHVEQFSWHQLVPRVGDVRAMKSSLLSFVGG